MCEIEKSSAHLRVGDKVIVHNHNVVGKVEGITNDAVVIRKEDGGLRYFGSYYFDQIEKLSKGQECLGTPKQEGRHDG